MSTMTRRSVPRFLLPAAFLFNQRAIDRAGKSPEWPMDFGRPDQVRGEIVMAALARPGRVGGLVLATALVIGALSCSKDIVAPRRSPTAGDYASPEATLRTMARGLAAKGPGASAWLGAFADSTGPEDGPAYHHVFDPMDLAIFESECGCQDPTDWGRSQEQQFYADFLNVRPSDEYAAVFDSVPGVPDVPATSTQTLVYRRYRVLATSLDGHSAIVIAIGFAHLEFVKVSADHWLIARWTDHVDQTIGAVPVDPYQLTLGRRRLESTR